MTVSGLLLGAFLAGHGLFVSAGPEAFVELPAQTPVLTSQTGPVRSAPRPLPTPEIPQNPALSLASSRPEASDPPQAKPPLGTNLSIMRDWGSELPFLDLMKTSRSWIGHLPGQWGGVSHDDLEQTGFLDANGWPVEKPQELSSIGTLILTDLPEDAKGAAGRYVLRFEGDGIVEVRGRAQNVRYGKNRVTFDYMPGRGPVDIRIQRTDRGRTGDYVRNITVVHEDHLKAYDAGALFHPEFLARASRFAALRFMDWQNTNDSTQSEWAGRPRVEHYTYGRPGVPLEIMIELANSTRVDPWFSMPHLATDDYFREFAEQVRDTLHPDLKVYVEFSNEVWNWQFEQSRWADEMALKRWGKKDAWVQYYAMRSVQMAEIWTEVFGPQADERLIRVISSQTGWTGLEKYVLDAPHWVAEGNPRPAEAFDAYAITGYFGSSIGKEKGADLAREWLADSLRAAEVRAESQGLTGIDRDAFIAEHRFDEATKLALQDLSDGAATGEPKGSVEDLINRLFRHHKAVADANGLDLIAYEAGTHLVGRGPVVNDDDLTEFFIHVNYSEGMGTLYDRLLEGWAEMGGGLFTVYSSTQKPSKWGSWGHLRHLSDDNSRWQALQRAMR